MKKTFLMTMATIATTMATAQGLHYPKAEKDGTVDIYYGTRVADPYRWLENDTSRQTMAWVEAENRVTNEYLSKIPLRKRLLKRMTELSCYEKVSAPVKHNGKWYFSKNSGLQNQSVVYVMDELGGEPRVFLDPNTLSQDGTVALKGIYHSHNGKYAAYTISRSGSDWQEFYVIDLKTGQLTSDHIEWAKFSGAAWLGDGFFYSAYDAPVKGKEFSNMNANHKIYYHKIGTPQSDDVLFYENPAYPKRFYDVTVNEEETMMFLTESGAGAGNNLFVRDLRKKDAQFIQLTSNMDLQYSPIETEGDKFYIYTNDGAPKGRLMVADIRQPGSTNWQEVIGQQQYAIESIDCIDHQFIVTYNQDASSHAYVYTMDGQLRHEVRLPSLGSVYFSGDKKDKECFYTFTSFTQPSTIYRYDINSNESPLYRAPKVAFKMNDFTTEQVFFQSKDGTRIPMFLTYKKGLKRNGKNPVYLYVYVGFNIALGPSFSATRI
ncbi:MAG: S9 family peptidase, partial [Prevotella sp.]|nr:S9 family peptidase [Prevotella sp.]